MLKKVLIIIPIIVAVLLTATYFLWTQKPSYTLAKIMAAAKAGDQEKINRLVDIDAVANSVVTEALKLSSQKFSILSKTEDGSPKATDFFRQMAKSFLRDTLYSKTPGFKFTELSMFTYLLLQSKLFWDSLFQTTQIHAEDIVDVHYDLQPIFQKNYYAIFTYKKIGTEWVLFEIKDLKPR